MSGKILCNGGELSFRDIHDISIMVNGKPWVVGKFVDAKIEFVPSAMGGFEGWGNYLKQWRKRRDLTQDQVAEMFKVSQPFIANVEKNKKRLPVRIFQEIQKNVRSYGRK